MGVMGCVVSEDECVVSEDECVVSEDECVVHHSTYMAPSYIHDTILHT